ncbi:MAG: nuclear transport factor 2 family protein [Hyphomonadaceae bacterium]
MSDQDDIVRLQQDYARLFDARDADAYANLYTSDCVVTTPWGQEINGRDKMRKAVLHTPPGPGWHRPGETTIDVRGDAASAIARYTAMDRNGDLCTGRYEDTYRKTPEGWRIASRKVFIEERTPAGAWSEEASA